MRGDQLSEDALLFGPFRLSPSARLLQRDGREVALGGRALDILILLVERAGEVVTKKDLMARVWADISVDEGSLRFHVAALRKALGDGEAGARYVANVPSRGYCFVAPVAGSKTQTTSAAASQAPTPPPSLPPRSARMVGRDGAVQDVADNLSAHRFVTLVGPGGIGKTTVAVAAAHTLASAFGGQVFFVDFGPLGEPRLALGAIASVLELRFDADDAVATLAASMREMRLLLVLDGCEHVIEPIALLAEALFTTAPSVHILATSRESLRAEGEHVRRLSPLPCPPRDDGLSAANALAFPAAQLFIARALAASSDFEFTDADALAVADICHRLDGIPLALEIAAGRVDAFGVKELAAGLDDRILLASGGRRTSIPRHQTLKATLDWSVERLPPPEQILLNRLSIFHDAFTLAAAAAVCSVGELTERDISDGVIDLVAKSLLVASFGKDASYRLLDATRQYAGEKLEQSGEREVLAERHARYICRLLELAAKQWNERPSPEWLATYRPQVNNLRAALRWAFSESGDSALGANLAIVSVPLWSQLSLVDEPLEWVERALAASARLSERDLGKEMQLHAALGGLQMYAISSVKQSNNAWNEALAIASQLGDADYQLRALRALWAEAINSGECRLALSLAEQFEALAGRVSANDDEIVANRLVGTALHFLGEHEKARIKTERMLELYVGSAARSQLVRYQFNQKVSARIVRGRILWIQGRTGAALRDIEENVEEALSLEHSLSLCNVLAQAACPIALLAGELDAAQRYVDLLRGCTAARGMDVWRNYAVCFDAGLDIERGEARRGLDRLRPAMEELHRSGFGYHRPSLLMMRARALMALNRDSEAQASLTEAMAICERTGERWCLPELYRLSGEAAIRNPGAQAIATAAAAFHRALTLAQEQQAVAWELRAAASLARCGLEDGRLEVALRSLKRISERLPEDRDRPEMKAAAALLTQRGPDKG